MDNSSTFVPRDDLGILASLGYPTPKPPVQEVAGPPMPTQEEREWAQAAEFVRLGNEKEPGRYELIPASEVARWEEKWRAEEASSGLAGDAMRLMRIGGNSALMGIREAVRQIPKIGPGIVEGLDSVDRWMTGKDSGTILKENNAYHEARLTPETAAARHKKFITEEKNDDGSTSYGLGPAWSDPRSYFSGAIESVPGTAVTMVPGGVLARGAFLRTMASGAGREAAAAAAARTALVAGAVSEGIIGGGGTAHEVRDQINALPEDTLKQSSAYQALLDGGASPQEARTALAGDVATRSFVLSGVANGIFGGMGDRVLARIVAEGVSGGLGKRLLKGVGQNAVAEGLLEELPQSVGEKVAENYAMRDADPNRRPFEGAANAGVSGAIAGGIMGAGFGAAGAARPQEDTRSAPPAPPSPAAEIAPPVPRKGPLARAVEYGAAKQAERASAAPPNPTGLPGTGENVAVTMDGGASFPARIEGYKDGEALVSDPASGEILQVPLAAIRQLEPEQYGQQIANAAEAAAAASAPQTQPPVEMRSDLPPARETRAANTSPAGMPVAGQRAIVDTGSSERFAATVQGYVSDAASGKEEVLVRRDDGSEAQVPLEALKVSALTPAQIEKQALESNPPLPREKPGGGRVRRFEQRYVEMPDDLHARLYDLGRLRRDQTRMLGKSKLDMDDASGGEQEALAAEFGMGARELGQIADDYRYRVERAARGAKSDLPVQMHKVNSKLLGRKRTESARAAGDTGKPFAKSDASPDDKTGPISTISTTANAGDEVKSRFDEARSSRTSEVNVPQNTGSNNKPEPVKWFGARERAQTYMDKKKLGATHEIVEAAKGRFEVRPKMQAFASTSHTIPSVTKGQFGPIYEQYRHDASGAIERLMRERTGEARAALHHPQIGDIDLVYGREGSEAKNFEDGHGISKIAKKRPRVLDDLQGFVENLGVKSRSANRIILEDEERRALVRLEWDGEQKTWLLSAYDKNDVPAAAGGRTGVTNRAEPTPPVGQVADTGGRIAGYPKKDNKEKHRLVTTFERNVPATTTDTGKFSNGDDTARSVDVPVRNQPQKAEGSSKAANTTMNTASHEVQGGSPEGFAPKPVPQSVKNGNKPGPQPQSAQFAGNRLFTADKVEAARARLRSKMAQLNSGIDPEVMIDGMTIAGAYIESGVRSFADYARRMADDFGPQIKPYLLSFWEGARNFPGLDTGGMTSVEESKALHSALMKKSERGEVDAVIGETMARPQKRKRKTGAPSDMTLTQDWGLDHIDGYESGDRETGNQTKDAFLKEAQSYLTAVSELLAAKGYLPHGDKKGKAEKPILVNEGGMATSGEVSLSMYHPDGGGVHVKIGETSLLGVVPTTPSGIAILFRSASRADKYGMKGVNRWAPVDLSAADFAAQIDEAAKRGATNETRKLATHSETLPSGAQAQEGVGSGKDTPQPDAEVADDTEPDAGSPAQGDAVQGAQSLSRDESGRDAGSLSRADRGADDGLAGRGEGETRGRGEEPGQPALRSDASGAAGQARDGDQDARGDRARRGIEGHAGDGGERKTGAAAPGEDQEPDLRADQRDGAGRDREPGLGRRDVATAQNSERKHPVSAVGENFRIKPGAVKRIGSWRETAERNVGIVELANRIEREGRRPDADEAARLTRFTGWGASEIANGVFPDRAGKFKPGWENIGERLRSALTPEEYAQARRTTQYAHYTGEDVIRPIYSALERMGFAGGRVLEPGMGIGLFNGLMPSGMAANSRYTGVEYDTVTGRIARLLYPQSDVIIGDYAATPLPKDFFDLAIGNPPFSSTVVANDPEYKKFGFMLHDYFFAKTIDRVKPGGLLVFVTSKGTMDKGNDRARRYLAARADLVGAIRLPQTAFKENAGTDVVTDILFLQKRVPGAESNGVAWKGGAEISTPQGAAQINEYFAAHPEMVLGNHELVGSMYRANEYTVTPRPGVSMEEELEKALARLPQAIYKPGATNPAGARAAAIERDYNPAIRKEGGLYVNAGGELMQVESGAGVALTTRIGSGDKAIPLKDKEIAFLKDWVGLRDALKTAYKDQLSDGDWQTSFKALRTTYDSFVGKHGPLRAYSVIERDDGEGKTSATRRFRNDPLLRLDVEGVLAHALEKIDQESGEIRPDKVLTERVLSRPREPEIRTVNDALFVSLNANGRLDIDHVARLAGMTKEEAISALGSAVFEAPNGEWQTSDKYLSGDVRAKLRDAEAAARIDKRFSRNVEALINVQPRPLGPAEITVNLGQNWIKPAYIETFAKEAMGETFRIHYSGKIGAWEVLSSGRGYGEFNTAKMAAHEILLSVLNNRQIKVMQRDADGNSFIDITASESANNVATRMREAFRTWVWTDKARADELVAYYNDHFNNIAPRKFDGSHLTLPGVSLKVSLHPHQKRAIWRAIQDGDTYLAHAVGAGKTYSMIASGMEERRLGLSKKPMFVVPNHMLAQFAREFLELYPAANIMVADETNFHTSNRKRFVAQAALNDPDAIVITHSAFGRIGMSEDFSRRFIQGQIEEWQDALADTDKADRFTRKQIERRIEQLERRIDAMTGDKAKKDAVLTFEEIGADRIFLDEAHEFRKLDFATNQGAIKGIDPSGSQRAMDLFMKVAYLREKNPGRALVMASGTPVTNTMGELFTVQRFFQKHQLEADGHAHFDAWANHYGAVVAGFEQNAAGGYEIVSRFAKFQNVPELMRRVRSFMDILTNSDLGAIVTRPQVKDGGRKITITQTPDGYQAYQKVLQQRITKIRQHKGRVQKGADIILKVITDGKFSAVDMRFVDSTLPNDPKSKLNQAIDAMIEAYRATADKQYFTDGKLDPLRGSSIVLFSDIGLGEQATESRGFDMRAWIEHRFAAAGIARDHIAFIRDYKTHARKERLFADMREGKKRILIGGKDMETGVNVQKRLAWLGHLDAPWYPASVEQREGRIIRQGNQNKEVTVQAFATRGSYDSTMWGMNARKARFIEQAMSGDDSVRSLEDVSEASAFEVAAALASGDERYLKLAGLKADVERLERLATAHHAEQRKLGSDRYLLSEQSARDEERAREIEAALKQRKAIRPGGFEGKVGAAVLDSREAFSNALFKKFADLAGKSVTGEQQIGEIGGFPLMFGGEELIGKYRAAVHVGVPGHNDPILSYPLDSDMAVAGIATRAANQVNGLERHLDETRSRLAQNGKRIEQIDRRIGAPFPEQAVLIEKHAEYIALQSELAAETSAAQAAQSAEAAAATVEIDPTPAPANVGESSGRKYSIGTSFEKHIDAIARGHHVSPVIALGTTPDVLLALGAPRLTLTISEDAIWKAIDKHGLTPGEIKAAIRGLDAPLMVFTSRTENDSLVALVEFTDRKNRPLVAALHFGKLKQNIPSNAIASLHGKDGIGFIRQWIDAGLLRYVDERRVDAWTSSKGLQLPKIASLVSKASRNRFHRPGDTLLRPGDIFKKNSAPSSPSARNDESEPLAGAKSQGTEPHPVATVEVDADPAVAEAGQHEKKYSLAPPQPDTIPTRLENLARGKEALSRLMTSRDPSSIPQWHAMHRYGLGWISFLWEVGARGELGIAHLIEGRTDQGKNAAFGNARLSGKALTEFIRETIPAIIVDGKLGRWYQVGSNLRRNLYSAKGTVVLQPVLDTGARGKARINFIATAFPGAGKEMPIQTFPVSEAVAEKHIREMLAGAKGKGTGPYSLATQQRPSADGAPSAWVGPSTPLAGSDLGRAGSGSAHAVSQTSLQETAVSGNRLMRELAAHPLGGFAHELIEAGKVRIVERAPADAPDGAQGWTDSDGAITLVAGAIPEGKAMAVLLHEAFHAGGRPLLGDAAWGKLMDGVAPIYRQFEHGKGPARAFFDAARTSVREAGVTDAALAVEEFAAYAIEHAESAPRALRLWVDRAMGHIKAWLLRRFGVQAGAVTPGQLRAIAVAAIKDGVIGEKGFGHGTIKNLFHIAPDGLTGPEGAYLRNFRDADALRDRIAASGRHRGERLLAKGLLGRTADAGAGEMSEKPSLELDDPDPKRKHSLGGRGARVSTKIGEFIRSIARGDINRQTIAAGETPEIMAALGMAGKYLTIRPDVIWKAIDKHGLTPGDIEAAIRDAYAPLMVFQHSNGNLNSLGKSLDHRSRPLILAADMEAVGPRKELIVTDIRTIHGKDGTGFINEWIGEGRLRYWDKAGAALWLSSTQANSGRMPHQRAGTRLLTPANEVLGPADIVKNTRKYSLAPLPSRAEAAARIEGRLTDLTPAMLAAIPLNYFSELKRPVMTAVDEYLSIKRAMDTYRGNQHKKADDIAQEWLSYSRLGIGKDGKAKAAELADLMHASTLAGVDPSAAPEAFGEDGPPESYAALRERFLAMPAKGRALFEAVRDDYKAQSEEMDRIILANVRRAMEIAAQEAQREYLKEIERIEKSKSLTAIEKADALYTARKQRASAVQRSHWANKARVTRLREAFETSRLSGPYFPLARFGRYFVALKDVDGEVLSFQRFERAAEMNAAAGEMRATAAKDYPGSRVETGVVDDTEAARQAMDPRLVAEIETILGGASVDPSIMDSIWQRYLQTLPEMSIRKRQIHRKGTAGFQKDALRAYANHMFHASHQMARMKFSLELQEAVNKAAEQARISDHPVRGSTLVNELRKRHKWVMEPMGSAFAQKVTSAMFLWYLAASPASAMVNLTQTVIVGLPVLGARLGGIGKASAAVMKAAGDFISGKGDSRKSTALTADEKGALDAFYESGLIDRTRSHDLAGVGNTGTEYSPLGARIMGKLSWMFHQAEVFNREVTALAAYRMARAQGETHSQAVNTAHDLTWKTHFDYANSNRPRIMQSDTAKIALVFQNFQINMWYRFFRDFHQTFKGETPQARREARYQLAGIMGMLTLLGGVTSVFGFKALMMLAGLLLDDRDDPRDFEEEMRGHIMKLFGPDIGAMILKGVPGKLLNLDIASRVGMADFLIRTRESNKEGRDAGLEWLAALFGASASTVLNGFDGVKLIMDGNTMRGLEIMAPKAVKDLMQAYRFADEGLENRKGNTVLERDRLSLWDIGAKAMGFTSGRIAETYERNRELASAEHRVLDERRLLIAAWATARMHDDNEARAKAMENIKAFNAQPYARGTIRISQETLIQSLRTRQRNDNKREEGVLIENKTLDRFLRSGMPEHAYQ